jgi:hypothetical protein
VTRYEASAGLLSLGVLLIILAVFISVGAPDLGESLARGDVPVWGLIALLALAGVGMLIFGGVRLLLGRFRKE